MLAAPLSARLDALIDELIMDGGVEAASLASILLTAKDSVLRDDHVTLSRRVWAANNDLMAGLAQGEPLTRVPTAGSRSSIENGTDAQAPASAAPQARLV
jgi:hypothetical protein